MSSKHIDHSQDKYIVIGVIVVLILIGLAAVLLPGLNTAPAPSATSTNSVATTTAPASASVTALAQCLATKKIAMYGAAWCTHCQDQKAAFGSAWQYVPYVECPDNTQVCLSKGVQGYPTWIKADGTKLEGFTELPKLAEWAGCAFN